MCIWVCFFMDVLGFVDTLLVVLIYLFLYFRFTFIRHVRTASHSEYRLHLVIAFVHLYGMWGKIKGSYSFGTPWLHLVIAFVHLYGMWGKIKHGTSGDCFRTFIRHFVLLYGMRGEIKDSFSFGIRRPERLVWRSLPEIGSSFFLSKGEFAQL